MIRLRLHKLVCPHTNRIAKVRVICETIVCAGVLVETHLIFVAVASIAWIVADVAKLMED